VPADNEGSQYRPAAGPPSEGRAFVTRRTLTATTAGALGLLGAILGTLAGYIVIGLPLMAAAVGWLLAGRQPAAMSHQPIE
jgi:putative ABC transport system permease protein